MMLRRAVHPIAMVAALGLLPALLPAQRFEIRRFEGLQWFKGNTHTHTLGSDGDSSPEVVARWYKDHGYRFLVLSDHNVFTDPAALAGLVDSTFLLIGGEELTTQVARRPVHVNGLGLTRVIAPRNDSTLVGTLQANVDAIREEAAVPHIFHPNFRWAFGLRELLQVRNDSVLEIYSGHPLVHVEGGDDAPGMEAVWDGLLSAGKRVYGIAVDDAHHFQGEFSRDRSNPGRGWIAVAAGRLDAGELLRHLERGLFYASSGVELDSVRISARELVVGIRQQGDFKYTTTFIGDGGRVLARTGGLTARFTLEGERARGLTYVRARVDDSGGGRAWIQPAFVVR
jgi:hypothetical protein